MLKLVRETRLLFFVILPLIVFSFTVQSGESAVRDIKKIDINERQLQEAVASRTLTWLTGSSSNNDYISVGRMANYFGFVGLRVASGQSLTRSDVANDTLAVLNEKQRDALIDLLQIQKAPFEETQASRYEMNRALEGLLVGEKITRDSFLELGGAYGRSEAMLGYVVAQGLGDVAQTLTTDQKTALAQIRAAHISGQGQLIERSKLKLKLTREEKQELVNIAARLLSWTTGTREYNDFEVVGKPSQHFGFVSLRQESNHGVKRGVVADEVLQILDAQQETMLDAAAAHNVKEFNEFMSARGRLMRTFEVALSGEMIDAELVRRYGGAVGVLEASMTWAQAMAMLDIRSSMTDVQTVDLLRLRNKYVAAKDVTLPQDPVERGRQLFAQCALCHDSTNVQAAGPNLHGVVGRSIAKDPEYNGYSLALRTYAESGSVWSETVLDSFLESPRSLVPGTYMGFDGLDDAKDRVALIAYLKMKN